MHIAIFFFLLNILIVAIIYIRVMTEVKKGRDESLPRDIRSEVESIIVEFNRMADRNISILEDKIDRLSRLLELADRKISGLESQIDVKVIKITRPRNPSTEDVPVGEESQPVNETTERLSTKEKFLILRREGLAPEEIRKNLKLTKGEMELFLSLEKNISSIGESSEIQ